MLDLWIGKCRECRRVYSKRKRPSFFCSDDCLDSYVFYEAHPEYRKLRDDMVRALVLHDDVAKREVLAFLEKERAGWNWDNFFEGVRIGYQADLEP